MAESDTWMIILGVALLAGMGVLIWKTFGDKMKMTEFVRDSQGRVIQIIEK